MRGSMLEQAFSKSAFLVMENAPFLGLWILENAPFLYFKLSENAPFWVYKYWKTHQINNKRHWKTHHFYTLNYRKTHLLWVCKYRKTHQIDNKKHWKTHHFYTLNYRKTHLFWFVNIGKRTKLTIRNIGKHIFLVFWNIWNTHLDDDKLHFMFRFWRLCILVLLYCKHVRHALFSKARCWIDWRFRTGRRVKSIRDNFLALPTNIISVGKVFFEAFANRALKICLKKTSIFCIGK